MIRWHIWLGKYVSYFMEKSKRYKDTRTSPNIVINCVNSPLYGTLYKCHCMTYVQRYKNKKTMAISCMKTCNVDNNKKKKSMHRFLRFREVRAFSSQSAGRGFELRPHESKAVKIGIGCFLGST